VEFQFQLLGLISQMYGLGFGELFCRGCQIKANFVTRVTKMR